MKILNSKIQISSKNRGFTLIEVLVAVTIFVILMTIGITSFTTIINQKKKSSSNNELQAAGRTAMEVMSNAIEKSDLNDSDSSSPAHFGFYVLNNDADSFTAGPVNTGNQLIIIKNGVADTNFKYIEGVAPKLQKNANDLISSSAIEIISFSLSGYEKTGTNFVNRGTYQQPFVTIKMKLRSARPDKDGNYTYADFQTTVKPQAFDNLGYVEVQSGLAPHSAYGPPSPDKENIQVPFNKPFSGSPIVVSARTGYPSSQGSDALTYIKNVTTAKAVLSDTANSANGSYWMAINGSIGGVIESGTAKVARDPACNNCISLHVAFQTPFNSIPNIVIMKGFKTGGTWDQQSYISNKTKEGFWINGDGTDQVGQSYYWIATTLTNLADDTITYLESGQQNNTSGLTCSTFTEFFGLSDRCELRAKINYNPPFSRSIPIPIVTYWSQAYQSVLESSNDTYTTPGVGRNASALANSKNGFSYYTLPFIISPSDESIYKSIGINYISTNGDFKIKWSYQ